MNRISLSLAAGALLALATPIFAPAPALAQDPVRAAFVYVGPVGDHGWTYRHDVGRQAIEAHFGDAVETSYVENVAEGADAERVIRQLAMDGNDIIFTTSFGFMNATAKVAEEFPDIYFEHATGYRTGPNLSAYNARFYEGRWVIGLIAAELTQSNIIGYIASFPIPEVIRGINAFTRALHSINPEADVKVVWANTWYDPGLEADAANALIDQGADILVQHTDSPAALTVAQERGVMGFGQASDMAAFAPNSQLTAIIDNWDSYYIARVQAVIDGTWESSDTWDGLAEAMVTLAPYNTDLIPADVIADAEAARLAIIDGTLHPFIGPLNSQSGEPIIAAGEILADGALLGMDYYIEGVTAALPN